MIDTFDLQAVVQEAFNHLLEARLARITIAREKGKGYHCFFDPRVMLDYRERIAQDFDILGEIIHPDYD